MLNCVGIGTVSLLEHLHYHQFSCIWRRGSEQFLSIAVYGRIMPIYNKNIDILEHVFIFLLN